MTRAIQIEDCSITFGKRQIIDHLNWTVYKGEIATLIGPNGCGKSTLLHAIMGTVKSTGTIYIGEKKNIQYKDKELAQQMAFLPQVPSIPKDMVVEELVQCGRFPYQVWWKENTKDDLKIVDEVMEITGISHLRNNYVNSLSGGERQRVWIAMALAQEPSILLLDEPTTYLDINHQLEIMELLQDLNRRDSLTVVMVLHELNQAAQYSHRIGVLYEGHMIADGAPNDVIQEDLLGKVFSIKGEIEYGNYPYVRVQGLLR